MGVAARWQRRRHQLGQLLRLSDEVYRLRVTMGQSAIGASRSHYGSARGLADVEVSVFSQWGEDGILDFLLEVLGISRPRCLEIGVGDYSEANTRFLAEIRGAQAVVVDASPALTRRLKTDDITWRNTVVPLQMFVTRSNIHRCLREVEKLGGPPDVISMDVDGMDYWLLEALQLDGCSVVVAEYNALLGAERPIVVPYADHFSRYDAHYSGVYYGASLPALVHLLDSRGFTFVGTTNSRVNAFFVQNDLVDLLPFSVPDPTVLGPYTQRSVRDSRDKSGSLAFLSQAEQQGEIGGLPVVDVVTGEIRPLPAG
jgi:hypothetical protein